MRLQTKQIHHVDKSLLSNSDVMMVAVQKDGNKLKLASEQLRGNKAVVKAAIKQDPRALQFATQPSRDSKAIVIDAIRRGGESLLVHASVRLQADPKVLEHVSPETRYHIKTLSEAWKGIPPP